MEILGLKIFFLLHKELDLSTQMPVVKKNTHIFLISWFIEFKKTDTADKLPLDAIIDSQFVFSKFWKKMLLNQSYFPGP